MFTFKNFEENQKTLKKFIKNQWPPFMKDKRKKMTVLRIIKKSLFFKY